MGTVRKLVPVVRECVSYSLSHEPPRQLKKWVKRHIVAIDTRIVTVKFGHLRTNGDCVVHLHVVSGVQHTRKFRRKVEAVLRAAELRKEVNDGAARAS